METRKITIVSTKDQTKHEIMTTAETLAELKAACREHNIDYTGMTFYEGITRTEIVTDTSLLPKDVMYKGNVTNELVFMLTNTNKKIKNGATIRGELYEYIKIHELQDLVKAKYGKNFTNCTTNELSEVINEYKEKQELKPLCSDLNCASTYSEAEIAEMFSFL